MSGTSRLHPFASMTPLSRVVCTALGLLLLASCGAPPADPSDSGGDAPWTGRIWMSSDESAAPGTTRVFLPDGTLVLNSCVETYRLARWRPLGGNRIEWDEDGIRIEADVASESPDELRLRLRLKTDVKEERYRAARVPYVCPDRPRE